MINVRKMYINACQLGQVPDVIENAEMYRDVRLDVTKKCMTNVRKM